MQPPLHSGFDIALAIDSDTLIRIFQTFVRFGKMTSRFTAEDVTLGLPNGGSATASYDLALTEPELELSGDRNNRLVIRTRLRGWIRVVIDANTRLNNDVLYEIELEVPARVDTQGQPRLAFVLTQGVLTDSRFTARFSGGVSPDPVAQTLLEPEFPGAVLDAIRESGDIVFDLPLGDLGLPAGAGISQASVFVRDEALVIAALVSLGPGDNPQRQLGVPEDFTSVYDMAAVAHPRILKKTLSDAMNATKDRMQEVVDRFVLNEERDALLSDLTLDRISFELKDGYVRFVGTARKHNIDVTNVRENESNQTVIEVDDWADITADFAFSIGLRVQTFGAFWWKTPVVESVVGGMQLEESGWLKMVTNAARYVLWPIFGWLGPLVTRQLEKAGRDAVEGIAKQIGGFDRPAVWDMPVADDVRMTGRTGRVYMGERGVEFFYRLNGPSVRPGIFSKGASAAYPPDVKDRVDVTWVFTVPPGWRDYDDPELVCRYELRRFVARPLVGLPETSTLLDAQEFPFADLRSGSKELPGVLEPGALRHEMRFRIVRRNDTKETELFETTSAIETRDKLDRSHAFVRWKHTVWRRFYYVENSAGEKVRFEEGWPIERLSKIHRTAFPGRCHFADRYSESTTMEFEYFNDLPYDHDKLETPEVRQHLCDYCFFGGPDKSDLTFPLPG